MALERECPIDWPAEVLDRVLDKGIVASTSLRFRDAPIEVRPGRDQVVAEPDTDPGDAASFPRAA